MGGHRQIELARASDTSSIEALSREFGKPEFTQTWLELVHRAMTSRQANVAVVRDDSEIIAVGVMQYEDTEAFLSLLAVTPKWQRQGVGNALLGWLEKTAFVAGLRSVAIELRPEDAVSRGFYRAAGYRRQFVDRWTYWKSLDEIRIKALRQRWAPKR